MSSCTKLHIRSTSHGYGDGAIPAQWSSSGTPLWNSTVETPLGNISSGVLQWSSPSKGVKGTVKDLNLLGVMCSTSLRLSHTDFCSPFLM